MTIDIIHIHKQILAIYLLRDNLTEFVIKTTYAFPENSQGDNMIGELINKFEFERDHNSLLITKY